MKMAELPAELLENWKDSCLRLLNGYDPDIVLDLMEASGARNTMEIPAADTITVTLRVLEDWQRGS